MKHSTAHFLSLASVALALSACGGGSDTETTGHHINHPNDRYNTDNPNNHPNDTNNTDSHGHCSQRYPDPFGRHARRAERHN